MTVLEYPFDEKEIYQKRRKIKKSLLQEITQRKDKADVIKLAILGGATTNDVSECIEIFLLKNGIQAEIYQSDFNRFYEEAVFDNEKLKEFNPDVIYIHTSSRNIINFPSVEDNADQVARKLEEEYERYIQVWEGLSKYGALIIQNNFEYITYRVLGNLDSVCVSGRINFINRLNELFRIYAVDNKGFYINDINYLSAMYGVDKWAEDSYWYMYKMSPAPGGCVHLANSVANIIKAAYGKNKKAIALDLDNTLWGGIIAEEGADGVELGAGTPEGEAYVQLHRYLIEQKKRGIVLGIVSKNDEAVGMEGFNSNGSILKPEDFMIVKANWEPKSDNINAMAKEINISPTAIVFVDDNPVERMQVKETIDGIGVVELSTVENYIKEIDRNGYFECISLTEDDLKRNGMYMKNLERKNEIEKYTDYNDFLRNLCMEARIEEATAKESQRVQQLLNKCNQFNMTTLKYTVEEVENCINDKNSIIIYATLTDKFGDNGIVSGLVCTIKENCCNIDNWVMSCRVLKRDLEQAIIDRLVAVCKEREVDCILGRYVSSGKNSMVENLYKELGFVLKDNGVWVYEISKEYIRKNKIIKIIKG